MTPAPRVVFGITDALVPLGIPEWVPWLVAGVVALFVLMRVAVFAGALIQGAPGTPRALRGEARRLARRGEHERAGDLFRAAGDLSEAVEEYRAGQVWMKAAEVLAGRGNWEAAAALYEKADAWEAAAGAHKRAGNLKRAEANFLRIDKRGHVARMYEEAGEAWKAAAIYREIGRHEKAADLFERNGKRLEAAELYQKAYFHAIAGISDRAAASAREDAKKLEAKVVALYRQADAADRCIDFLMRAGLYAQAADLCLEVGRADKAIELYVRCGKEDRAAQLLEARGDRPRSSRLRAEVAMRRGELHTAAHHFEESGEIRLAAEAYEKMGDDLRAAEKYEGIGDLLQAAFLHAKCGDFRRAAELYEGAGDLESALRCYDSLGDDLKRAAIFGKAGKHVRAGAEYVRLRRWDEAIAALQKVAPAGSDSAVANALLGISFVEKGMPRPALERLDAGLAAGVGAGSAGPSRLECLYYRARALEGTGDLDEALLAYERVISVDARFRDAAARLEEVRARAEAAVATRATGGAAAARGDAGAARAAVPAEAAVSAGGETVAATRPGDLGGPARRTARGPALDRISPGAADGGGGEGPVDGEAKTVAFASLQGGRYRIMEEIGRGGMGVVYKCQDTLLDRIVAYKVLSAQIRDYPAALENFLREAKSAARLNHPNIVTIYDFGEAEGGYYMTLEYVAGKNLRQFVKATPDPEALRRAIVGICEGLAYAHGNAVIHRDVKPSNILISEIDRRAKILDFGLAKIVEDVSATASGVLGTPWYMSPEQVLGTVVTHQSDIYSLGIALFEVLTGELPFKGRDFGYHHVHTAPPSPRSISPSLSEDMDRIILKCIEKRPEDRWRNAEELAAAMGAAKL